MGSKICELSETLLEQIRTNKRSDEMTAHLKQCNECSDTYLVHSWMREYSGLERSIVKKPAFEKIWAGTFRGKKAVESELIERAMLPLKIGRIVSFVISISAILIFIIFKGNEIKSVVNKIFKMNFFESSFINPLVSMFKSSYFVSIPITIILLSFFIYFLFTILKHSGSNSFGNV